MRSVWPVNQATSSQDLATSMPTNDSGLLIQVPCLARIRAHEGPISHPWRHYKGLPVSSSIAEWAVNQVVSLRMAKRRQMRWSDEGAHLLAQVRAQKINGELKPRDVPFPLRTPIPAHDPSWDAYLMLEAA